jgi:hypothetical protein
MFHVMDVDCGRRTACLFFLLSVPVQWGMHATSRAALLFAVLPFVSILVLSRVFGRDGAGDEEQHARDVPEHPDLRITFDECKAKLEQRRARGMNASSVAQVHWLHFPHAGWQFGLALHGLICTSHASQSPQQPCGLYHTCGPPESWSHGFYGHQVSLALAPHANEVHPAM